MYNSFINNNLIHSCQSGFLSGHSTVYHLILLYHNSSNLLIINLKPKENGICGQLLNWIENYLSDRSQRLFIGTSCSPPERILGGIPEGSVLGCF